MRDSFGRPWKAAGGFVPEIPIGGSHSEGTGPPHPVSSTVTETYKSVTICGVCWLGHLSVAQASPADARRRSRRSGRADGPRRRGPGLPRLGRRREARRSGRRTPEAPAPGCPHNRCRAERLALPRGSPTHVSTAGPGARASPSCVAPRWPTLSRPGRSLSTPPRRPRPSASTNPLVHS